MTTLTILGSAGGAPSRISPASGYLVRSGASSFWIDAGTGTFMELARHIDPGTLTAAVISHIHVDHSSDIYGLYGYLAFGPSGIVPIPVLAPAGAAEHLASFARAGDEHVFHAVLALSEAEPGSATTFGDATISFGTAVHPVPAVVTRIDTPKGSIAYSGDTGPGSDLAQVAAGVDLLLCEATIAGVRESDTYPYHLTAAEAGRIAAEAGVGKLVVTHLAHGVDPVRAVSEAAAEFDGQVDLAEPGTTFTIGETT